MVDNHKLKQFLAEVGRVEFQAAIGMSTQLMTRALRSGLLPARKYRDAKKWCDINGFILPIDIFKWDHASQKCADGKQNANLEAASQPPDTNPVTQKQRGAKSQPVEKVQTGKENLTSEAAE